MEDEPMKKDSFQYTLQKSIYFSISGHAKIDEQNVYTNWRSSIYYFF